MELFLIQKALTENYIFTVVSHILKKNILKEGVWTCKNEEFIELDYRLFPEVTFENSPQEVEFKLVKK